MLVISRKPGEKLRIGDNVELVVLEISGSRVVIGIDAPREVAIRRVGPAGGDADDELEVPSADTASAGLSQTSVPAVSKEQRPFEYPTRAMDEAKVKPVKAPVVTVRRSRKLVIPPDGEPT